MIIDVNATEKLELNVVSDMIAIINDSDDNNNNHKFTIVGAMTSSFRWESRKRSSRWLHANTRQCEEKETDNVPWLRVETLHEYKRSSM